MTFKIGESGNPSGRPAGSKNKRPQFTKLLEPYAEKLVNKVIEMALDGDVHMLRLCFERLIPKAAHEPVTLNFDLSQINKQEYLMEFGRKIIAAVVNGEITPAEAKLLSGMADSHRRLVENGELRSKLDSIELAIKQGRG